MLQVEIDPSKSFPKTWRMQLSGLCAILASIGLARFAYAPLLPELVAAHWFDPAQAAYLGAANLAGYLAGALAGQRAGERIAPALVLRAMLAAATAAFFACAFPLSFLWFFIWRFLPGFCGGVLMVLVAPTVLPYVPPSRRGLASGVIFAGVGCGIVVSGVLVPLLLRDGLATAWLGLGVFSLILTVAAWNGWPDAKPPKEQTGTAPIPRENRGSWALTAIYAQYGLNAIGLVPHMIFLVDYIARGLGQGRGPGAQYWVLFGFAAMAGPLLAGAVADRVGPRRALGPAYLLQGAAIGLLALSASSAALIVSSLVIGAFMPGISALTLSRVRELAEGDAQRQKTAWSICTAVWAIGQAGGAYGFSYIFAITGGGYTLLFALGALPLAAAFVLWAASAGRRK